MDKGCFVDKIPEDKIAVGQIIRPHGIKGEMVIHCYSGQPDNICQYKRLFLIDSNGRISVPVIIRSFRIQKKKAIIALEGINNRTQLEKIVGAGVLVEKKALAELTEEQFYWHHYLNKEVKTSKGVRLGRVQRLFSNGAQDILVVLPKGSTEELFIPITKEFVIGEEREELIVDPPPGLLEINNSPKYQR